MIGITTMRCAAGAVTAAVVVAITAAAGSAGAATLQSQLTWGGPASEVTNGAALASDGSTYLTGFTTSFGVDGLTVFLVKFAASGSLAWQRTWEGPEMFASDQATDVAVAPDGSVYVTGSTQGVAGDVLLLKFSSDGSLLWQLRWGGSGSERGESVAVGADGSVYVVGGTSSFGTGSDLFVLKFTADGTLVWQQTWGPGRSDGVAIGPDGNVYVAGGAARPGGGADVIVLSLDPAGTLLWQRAYSAGEIADARGGLAVAADGSIYVSGGLQEPEGQIVDLDALLVKFAADGTLLWDRGWGGKSGDEAQGVAVAPDGTVLLAGNTNSFGAGIDDAFLLRLEPSGRRIDAVLFGGAGIDHGSDVEAAADGTISLAGNVQAPPWTFQDGPSRVSRLRGAVATPTTPLVPAAGTVADPAGAVDVPAGSTTYAGADEAFLLRIAP